MARHSGGAPLPARDLQFETIDGWATAFPLGERLNIPTATTADIWSGTAPIRPLPIAALGMSVVSTSASDNAGTALGAQTALVTFIDELGDWRVSDLLLLDGLTPVGITHKPAVPLVTAGGLLQPPTPPDGESVVSQVFRVQGLFVATVAGATEAVPRIYNLGTLKVVDTSTGLVEYDAAIAGMNRTLSAAFHTPRSWTSRSKLINSGTARGRAIICFAVNQGVGLAWTNNPLSAIDGQTVIFTSDAATISGVPRSDLQLVATTEQTNNVDVFAGLQIRLVPEAG